MWQMHVETSHANHAWLALVCLQLVGTACITAGFAIAKTWVHGNNNFVRQHGAVGITALVLVYSQVRPETWSGRMGQAPKWSGSRSQWQRCGI